MRILYYLDYLVGLLGSAALPLLLLLAVAVAGIAAGAVSVIKFFLNLW